MPHDKTRARARAAKTAIPIYRAQTGINTNTDDDDDDAQRADPALLQLRPILVVISSPTTSAAAAVTTRRLSFLIAASAWLPVRLSACHPACLMAAKLQRFKTSSSLFAPLSSVQDYYAAAAANTVRPPSLPRLFCGVPSGIYFNGDGGRGGGGGMRVKLSCLRGGNQLRTLRRRSTTKAVINVRTYCSP